MDRFDIDLVKYHRVLALLENSRPLKNDVLAIGPYYSRSILLAFLLRLVIVVLLTVLKAKFYFTRDSRICYSAS